MVKEAEPAEGKIAYVFRVYNMKNADGSRMYPIKQIAASVGISERTVRGYVYRCRHPAEYKQIVQNYFDRKRQKAGQAPAAPKQKKTAAPVKLPKRIVAAPVKEKPLTAEMKAEMKHRQQREEAEFAETARKHNKALKDVLEGSKKIVRKAAREKMAELATPRKTLAKGPIKPAGKAVLPKRK